MQLGVALYLWVQSTFMRRVSEALDRTLNTNRIHLRVKCKISDLIKFFILLSTSFIFTRSYLVSCLCRSWICWEIHEFTRLIPRSVSRKWSCIACMCREHWYCMHYCHWYCITNQNKILFPLKVRQDCFSSVKPSLFFSWRTCHKELVILHLSDHSSLGVL